MKQGVLVPSRVKLLLSKGHSCFRPRKTGERKRRSVRGCIVQADIRALALVVVKQGENDIPGLPDQVLPKRLGPKVCPAFLFVVCGMNAKGAAGAKEEDRSFRERRADELIRYSELPKSDDSLISRRPTTSESSLFDERLLPRPREPSHTPRRSSQRPLDRKKEMLMIVFFAAPRSNDWLLPNDCNDDDTSDRSNAERLSNKRFKSPSTSQSLRFRVRLLVADACTQDCSRQACCREEGQGSGRQGQEKVSLCVSRRNCVVLTRFVCVGPLESRPNLCCVLRRDTECETSRL